MHDKSITVHRANRPENHALPAHLSFFRRASAKKRAISYVARGAWVIGALSFGRGMAGLRTLRDALTAIRRQAYITD
jgi:hypothetical protein